MRIKSIAGKLSLALALALMALALAAGLSFSAIFRESSTSAAREQLEGQARVILSLINTGMHESMGRGRGSQMAYGRGSANYRRYLQALNAQAGIDAWVVDAQGAVTTGYQQAAGSLPEEAQALLKAVFSGETRYLKGFSDQQGLPTLTLGVPIRDGQEISGALLLHAPVETVREAEAAGVRALLFSLLIGLAAALATSLFLVRFFTRPLERVQSITLRLAQGDYSARTGLSRQDEVGDLARAVDSLSARLEEARRERKDAERLRQEFMANVSHELKTPVAVLRAMLEALRDGLVRDEARVKDYYRSMLSETSALDVLIRDQMELSRLQAPGFSLNKETLDLRQTAEDAAASAQGVAQKAGVTLLRQLPEEPVLLAGDPGRLRQMIWIVLDNALRFSPPGGTVTLRLGPGFLEILDEGPGIPEESLPRVFERFYRAPEPGKGPGSGLGLAIAKEIAQRHGMRVTASNRKEGGAAFRFAWAEEL